MIKADIVKQIAKKHQMTDKDVLAAVDAILESLKETIVENGRLEIRDFGVFTVKQRKGRIGRNPKNKKEYKIPPRMVVTFKPSKGIGLDGVSVEREITAE